MEAPDALSRNPVAVSLIDLPSQVTDPWYLEMKKKVIENPENYEKFKVKDEKLFKLISVNIQMPLTWVQVLPKEARRDALRFCHDERTSGHGGVFKTFNRLRQQVYYPRMRSDVKDYVQNCPVCQQYKNGKKNPQDYKDLFLRFPDHLN